MVTPLVLGIDLGTQQLKVIAVDCTSLQIRGLVSAAVHSESQEAGAVEQDPTGWWSGLCELTRRLVSEFSIRPEHISGIGLSGHMHTIVPLGADLQPVCNSIVWADTRAAAQAKTIASFEHVTAWNPSISAYSAPKIVWLRENRAEAFSRTSFILFPKDYLRLRMTGEVATDFSDASGTLAWDFRGRLWDTSMLSALQLPGSLFSQPRSSTQFGGRLSARAAEAMGLVPGIPVSIGAGDVAAAVIGSGVTDPNTLLVNAGTAAQVIVVQDTPQPYEAERGARYLFELGVDGKVFTMGALPSAGLSLEWWRGVAGVNLTYQDLDRLALQARSTPDSVMFIPYLQGSGTPYLTDKSLGTFVQMSSNTDMASMTRAVMEGVAFGIRLCAESLVAGRELSEIAVQVTGGVTKSAFMRELLACIFPGTVTYRDYSDVSLIGAAALGAAVGGVVDHARTFLSRFDFGAQEHPAQTRCQESYESLYMRFRHWTGTIVTDAQA